MLTLEIYSFPRPPLGTPTPIQTREVATVELEPGRSFVLGRPLTSSCPPSTTRVEVLPDMLGDFPVNRLPAEAIRIDAFNSESGTRAFARFESTRRDAWVLRAGSNQASSGGWMEVFDEDDVRLCEIPRNSTSSYPLVGVRVRGSLLRRPRQAPSTTAPPDEQELKTAVKNLREELYSGGRSRPSEWSSLAFSLVLHWLAFAAPVKQVKLFPTAFQAVRGSSVGWETYTTFDPLKSAVSRAWHDGLNPLWASSLSFQSLVATTAGQSIGCFQIAEGLRSLGVITDGELTAVEALVPELRKESER